MENGLRRLKWLNLIIVKEVESIGWSLSRWEKKKINTRMTNKFLAWAKLDIMGQWGPGRRKREEGSDAVLGTNIFPALVELTIQQGR